MSDLTGFFYGETLAHFTSKVLEINILTDNQNLVSAFLIRLQNLF